MNVGKYAPKFHMGFSVMSGVSVLEFASIFIIRYFAKWEEKKTEAQESLSSSHSKTATGRDLE